MRYWREEYPDEWRRISRLLLSFQLRPRDVAADGNCLFRAVSHQLHGHEDEHINLRKQVCRFIRKHKHVFEPLVDNGDVRNYVRLMRKNGEWGGSVELQALSACMDVNIVVYKVPRRAKSPVVIRMRRPRGHRKRRTVRLAYIADEHYSSVTRPRNDPRKAKTTMSEPHPEEVLSDLPHVDWNSKRRLRPSVPREGSNKENLNELRRKKEKRPAWWQELASAIRS